MLQYLTLAALLRISSALLVAEHSPCSVKCGNVLDSTNPDDVVCDAAGYGTGAGTLWKQCLTCELSSPYLDDAGKPAQADLQAALYNMRYATSQCIFEALSSSPCITRTSCGTLKDSFEYNGLLPNASAYGYCSTWDTIQVEKCGNCLDQYSGGRFLRNYVQILDGACSLRLPMGQQLGLEGSVFSTDLVNVTLPSPTADVAPKGPAGPLSLGQIVGVVIGGIVALLAIIGACIVINGKRKRKAYLRRREQQTKQWPMSPSQGGGEMFETPVSQRPLRGWDQSPVSQRGLRNWDESPVSAATMEHTYPTYFSPYSSQYNSPVNTTDVGRGGHQHNFPPEKARSIGVALSPDGDSHNDHWGDKKGKDKLQREQEEFELQEGVGSGGGMGHHYYPPPPPPQAPTLSHPGYGRVRHSPESSIHNNAEQHNYQQPGHGY
ncbi:hypothetical protein PG984_013234 [Apiospora sp. TS-2023a]